LSIRCHTFDTVETKAEHEYSTKKNPIFNKKAVDICSSESYSLLYVDAIGRKLLNFLQEKEIFLSLYNKKKNKEDIKSLLNKLIKEVILQYSNNKVSKK
jgi:hypothetical protein